jgi:hypothetical protein
MNSENSVKPGYKGKKFFVVSLMIILLLLSIEYFYYNKSKIPALNPEQQKALDHALEMQNNSKNITKEETGDFLIMKNHLLQTMLEDKKPHPEDQKISSEIERYMTNMLSVLHVNIKFLKNIDFTDEINFIKDNNEALPKNISMILERLEKYNQKYLQNQSTVTEYTSKEGSDSLKTRIINKLVDVKVKNPIYSEMIGEREAMSDLIEQITKYFYSIQLIKEAVTK